MPRRAERNTAVYTDGCARQNGTPPRIPTARLDKTEYRRVCHAERNGRPPRTPPAVVNGMEERRVGHAGHEEDDERLCHDGREEDDNDNAARHEEDWEHDASPALKATLRDILSLHLKQWEVLACTSELNEHSPRAEPTEDLPSRHDEELRCLLSPRQRTEVGVRFLTEGASFTSIHIVTAQVSAFGRMESRCLQGLSLFAFGVRKVCLFDSGTGSGTVGALVRE